MERGEAVKLLLDTHIWLWSFLQPERLIPRVSGALEDPETELWLSPISVWEALMLAERNRIRLDPTPEQWVREALRRVPMVEPALNREVAIQSRRLSIPTEDPADRFIAATALVHELTLATHDRNLLEIDGVTVLSNRRGTAD
ncbi:MAG TPA: type II toxin-antitoxin system VapC family toxin [Thermoanaerobaculia bacterium]|nr:type II toxin-antitoxin system VapC family toxin [Thermoanaerobaculia bacterium]